jgi:hypothetical protein
MTAAGRQAARAAASPRRGKRRERGAVSWVTLLLVLGIAGGAYAAVVFVPVWVLHYEVKQVVRDYGNQAVKNPDDAKLLEDMVKRIRLLAEEERVNEAGTRVRVPVVDVHKQDVVWERTKEPPSLHVEFEYPRSIELPWLNRTLERIYRVDLTMDLTRPDWGPAR